MSQGARNGIYAPEIAVADLSNYPDSMMSLSKMSNVKSRIERLDISGSVFISSLEAVRGGRGEILVLGLLDARCTTISLQALKAISHTTVSALLIDPLVLGYSSILQSQGVGSPTVSQILRCSATRQIDTSECRAAILFVLPRLLSLNGRLISQRERHLAQQSFLEGGHRRNSSLAWCLGLHAVTLPPATLGSGAAGTVLTSHGHREPTIGVESTYKIPQGGSKGVGTASDALGTQASFGVDDDMSWLDAHEMPTMPVKEKSSRSRAVSTSAQPGLQLLQPQGTGPTAIVSDLGAVATGAGDCSHTNGSTAGAAGAYKQSVARAKAEALTGPTVAALGGGSATPAMTGESSIEASWTAKASGDQRSSSWFQDAVRLIITSESVLQGDAAARQRRQAEARGQSEPGTGDAFVRGATDARNGLICLASHCHGTSMCLRRNAQALRGLKCEIEASQGFCPWLEPWHRVSGQTQEAPGQTSCYPCCKSALLDGIAPKLLQVTPLHLPEHGSHHLPLPTASQRALAMGHSFSHRETKARAAEGVITCAPLQHLLWLASRNTLLDLLSGLEVCAWTRASPGGQRAMLHGLSRRVALSQSLHAVGLHSTARHLPLPSVDLQLSGRSASTAAGARSKETAPSYELLARLRMCYKWLAGLSEPALRGFHIVLRHVLIDLPGEDGSQNGDAVAVWFSAALRLSSSHSLKCATTGSKASMQDALLLAAGSCIETESMFTEVVWVMDSAVRSQLGASLEAVRLFGNGDLTAAAQCRGFEALRPKQCRATADRVEACEKYVSETGKFRLGSGKERATAAARWLRYRRVDETWSSLSLLSPSASFVSWSAADGEMFLFSTFGARDNKNIASSNEDHGKSAGTRRAAEKAVIQPLLRNTHTPEIRLDSMLTAHLRQEPTPRMLTIQQNCGVLPRRFARRRSLVEVRSKETPHRLRASDVIMLQQYSIHCMHISPISGDERDPAARRTAILARVLVLSRVLAVRVASLEEGQTVAVLERRASRVVTGRAGGITFSPIQDDSLPWENAPPFFGSRRVPLAALTAAGASRVPDAPLVWSHASITAAIDTLQCVTVVWEGGTRALREASAGVASKAPIFAIVLMPKQRSSAADDLIVVADPDDVATHAMLRSCLDSLGQARIQAKAKPLGSTTSRGVQRCVKPQHKRPAAAPPNATRPSTAAARLDQIPVVRGPPKQSGPSGGRAASAVAGTQRISSASSFGTQSQNLVRRSRQDAAEVSPGSQLAWDSKQAGSAESDREVGDGRTPAEPFERVPESAGAAELLGAIFETETSDQEGKGVQVDQGYSQEPQQPVPDSRGGASGAPPRSPMRQIRNTARRYLRGSSAKAKGTTGKSRGGAVPVPVLDPLTRARLRNRPEPVRGNYVRLAVAPAPARPGASVATMDGYSHEIIELPCVRGHFPSMVPTFPTRKPTQASMAYSPHLRAERALDKLNGPLVPIGHQGQLPPRSAKMTIDAAPHVIPSSRHGSSFRRKKHGDVSVSRSERSNSLRRRPATSASVAGVPSGGKAWGWKPKPPDVRRYGDRPWTGGVQVRRGYGGGQGVLVGSVRSRELQQRGPAADLVDQE